MVQQQGQNGLHKAQGNCELMSTMLSVAAQRCCLQHMKFSYTPAARGARMVRAANGEAQKKKPSGALYSWRRKGHDEPARVVWGVWAVHNVQQRDVQQVGTC